MSNWEGLIRSLEKDIINGLNEMKTLKHLWYVPEENAREGRFNGIVFLGINSGGKDVRDNDSYERPNETDGYSYYHDEVWLQGTKKGEAPLQVQVRLLFIYLYKRFNGEIFKYDRTVSKLENINKVESEEKYDNFIKGVLAGNLCPFQSSSISNLLYPWHLQKDYLEVFWSNIFKNELRGETQLVITMGHEVLQVIKNVFGLNIKDFENIPCGWGNTKISVFVSNDMDKPSVVNLPHMSRCGIFGRQKGLEYIETLFRKNLLNA